MSTNKPITTDTNDVRIAIEGCGHGTLHAIYAAVEASCKERQWDGVDLLIIAGDFQAVRNAADLNAMSVPRKYLELGDFHEYYSGARKAPYLTIFVAGNHEASSHLWELYYGGWVAPNIYYMGAANVLRLGPLRIAGMSGIWKGFDYRKPHHERLPFSADDVKSFYHVREVDVRKLLQLRTQVDVGISHDWPRAIENHGNAKRLWQMKPDFERESHAGTLGSPAAEWVMDRLRPPYWYSAHMHCNIPNTTTRFLALDKCLPGRQFLQLTSIPTPQPITRPLPLTYDPEWLAILRVFHPTLTIGDPTSVPPPDLGEAAYLPLIQAEEKWVAEHIVSQNKLTVPKDFSITAPVHKPGVDEELTEELPREWTNPQTARFCEMLGVENYWDASEEERNERRERGPMALFGLTT
ncbi:lariat debranching enzyme, C-terminal domain-containing protein [Staphylotrichum tortipilum]|uniref:Lariat debranching enzyme, C-terminal domain-containing protein n=1 Tax=Staphylotrichum tortipilum TaxID=2831512 RepID=A0AAN6MMY1_9PEZI|nr:lariat debranching enzyme, C-terminal domain-containing protein [Staphylotrichum longicolle]